MTTRKFLIIEDDPSIRQLLRILLKKNFDWDILEAANGAVGLEILKNDIPDIILLDVSMPVMDGIETLERIRSSEIFNRIPVIIITAISDGQIVSSFAQKGITDYLLKPIDLTVSIERIKKMIENLSGSDASPVQKSKEHILLVDKDAGFKSFFNSALHEHFIVHLASNGADGIEIYEKYFPRYLFVSNLLGELDKKILTHKIREIAEENEVSIYLLTNEIKIRSVKVFNFDGIIKKSMDKVKFLHDINIIKERTPEKPSIPA
ncbi:MAG: response regulator [Melioribacteraceae bacterium]